MSILVLNIFRKLHVYGIVFWRLVAVILCSTLERGIILEADRFFSAFISVVTASKGFKTETASLSTDVLSRGKIKLLLSSKHNVLLLLLVPGYRIPSGVNLLDQFMIRYVELILIYCKVISRF